MNNEYINNKFIVRYEQDSWRGSNIKNTTKDMDIYRQILKDWENDIKKELGIRITYDFNENKFKIKWSESKQQIKKVEKEEIKKKYFSKRIEVLKIIFSPIILLKK